MALRVSTVVVIALLLSAAASASTFTVTNTSDSGAGSLRQAILDANASPGTNTIAFAIGSGPQLILPASPLPANTDTVTIDGTTQPGYSGKPLIGIDGSLFVSYNPAIDLQGSGSLVRGLSITNFHGADPTTFQGAAGIGVNATSCVVKSCWLGIALDGKTVGGNDHGLNLNSHDATIGAPGEGNVMSGGYDGLMHDRNVVYPPLVGGNLIQNNIIGLDPTGTTRKDNIYGMAIFADSDTIQNNIVAGNTYGDAILSGVGITLRGNKFGVNVFGTTIPSSSVTASISLYSALSTQVTNVVIGGPNPGDSNEISGGSPGLFIEATTNVTIQGNNIHGNPLSGIELYQSSSSTIVGNSIHDNFVGIKVDSGAGNAIRRNSIYGNYNGIQLSDSYPLLNDTGDLDTGGNLGQNYPVITRAALQNGSTAVTGTLNSTASQTFHLEFFSSPGCDASGYGEGKTYLGTTDVITNGSGDATFSLTLPATTVGSVITATATDGNSNTSEFSKCAAVEGPGTLAFTVSSKAVLENANLVLNVARTGGTVGAVTVNYKTASGTATAGSDFVATAGILTFPEGQSMASITVPLINDSIYEPTEQFTISLSGATGGATVGSPSTVAVTIIDDDPQPPATISVNDISTTEGNAGDKAVYFTVTLSRPLSSQLNLNTQLQSGSAVLGSDFDGNVATFLSFAPGETTKQVPVTVHGDSLVEPNETFSLVVTNLSYNGFDTTPAIAKGTGICTILNDDSGMQSVKVAVGSSAVMNIQLGNATTSSGTITVTSATPAVATVPSSFSFEPGRTTLGFNVQAVAVGTSFITAKLPASLGGATLSANAQVYEPATLNVEPSSLTIPVNTTAAVTLTMSPAPQATTTLTVSSYNGVIHVPATVTIGTNGRGTLSVTGLVIGSGALTVTLPEYNGSFDTHIPVRVTDAPAGVFVTNISPASGPSSGGTGTTISGYDFAPTCIVTFGGTAATNVAFVSPASLIATTPAHDAGTTDVAVTCGADQYLLSNGFTFVATAPRLTSVAPSFGSAFGGTTVLLTGSDLRSVCGVFFDGAAAKIIEDGAPEFLVVTAPPHRPGTVTVSLQCTDTSASLPSAFTYAAADDPSAVITDVNPLAGSTGQSVTVEGVRFRPSDVIAFADTTATVLDTTPTSHSVVISTLTPGKVAVTLTDAQGHSSTTGPVFTVLEPVTPEITSVTPSTVAPGGEIVIAGKGFRKPYTFALGESSAGTILDITFNRAVVRVDPSTRSGSYIVGVLNSNGNLAAIGPSINVAPDVTATSVSPICATATGGVDVTIHGGGFQPGAQVTFGSAAATNVRVVDAQTIVATVPGGKIGWPTLTVTNPGGDTTTLTRGFFYYSPYDVSGGCSSTRARGVHH